MKRAFVAAALAALVMQLIFGAIAAEQAKNGNGSRYIVDPFWPKDLPENWTLGQVGGIAVRQSG